MCFCALVCVRASMVLAHVNGTGRFFEKSGATMRNEELEVLVTACGANLCAHFGLLLCVRKSTDSALQAA